MLTLFSHAQPTHSLRCCDTFSTKIKRQYHVQVRHYPPRSPRLGFGLPACIGANARVDCHELQVRQQSVGHRAKEGDLRVSVQLILKSKVSPGVT